MTFEKIAIVIVFLVTLILLQLVIKYRGKAIKMSFPKTNNIDVRARLSLSKTERADLISIGSQSFLVIFSKKKCLLPRSRAFPAVVVLSDFAQKPMKS